MSRILFVYADPYYLLKQVAPYGLDCVAQHLRRHGHETRLVQAWLPDAEPEANLGPVIRDFQPDAIGLGVRNLDTCLACEVHGNQAGEGFRAWWFVSQIEAVARVCRELAPGALLVAGGGAYTVAPEALFERLGLDCGVAGPGEEPMRLLLEAWPNREAMAGVPGLVFREAGEIRRNPPWELDFAVARQQGWDPGFTHAYEATSLPVRLKRGCNQGCSYCVEPLIEGRRFAWRPQDEVLAQLHEAGERFEQVRRVFFVDTEMNLPDEAKALSLVRALAREGLHERFRFASQFLPRPFGPELADALAEGGFQVIFTADSCSDQVLARAGTSYRRADVDAALALCRSRGLETTVNLIFGLPGEDWESLEETAAFLHANPPGPQLHYEYTVGGRMYQGTRLSREALAAGEHVTGRVTGGLLEPLYHCSPVPPFELLEWLDAHLPVRLAFGNAPGAVAREVLALRYLLDQGRGQEAALRYGNASLAVQAQVFDPLFRGLADAGLTAEARQAAVSFLQAVQSAEDGMAYMETATMAQFYLQLAGG